MRWHHLLVSWSKTWQQSNFMRCLAESSVFFITLWSSTLKSRGSIRIPYPLLNVYAWVIQIDLSFAVWLGCQMHSFTFILVVVHWLCNSLVFGVFFVFCFQLLVITMVMMRMIMMMMMMILIMVTLRTMIISIMNGTLTTMLFLAYTVSL